MLLTFYTFITHVFLVILSYWGHKLYKTQTQMAKELNTIYSAIESSALKNKQLQEQAPRIAKIKYYLSQPDCTGVEIKYIFDDETILRTSVIQEQDTGWLYDLYNEGLINITDEPRRLGPK